VPFLSRPPLAERDAYPRINDALKPSGFVSSCPTALSACVVNATELKYVTTTVRPRTGRQLTGARPNFQLPITEHRQTSSDDRQTVQLSARVPLWVWVSRYAGLYVVNLVCGHVGSAVPSPMACKASVEWAYAPPARISAATQIASMISSGLASLRRASLVCPLMQ
jgi:hypothetical protein